MTTASFVRALRAFTVRRPFRPFVLEFMTGTELLVRHPEALAIDGDVIMYRSADGLYCLFDSGSDSVLRDAPPTPDSEKIGD